MAKQPEIKPAGPRSVVNGVAQAAPYTTGKYIGNNPPAWAKGMLYDQQVERVLNDPRLLADYEAFNGPRPGWASPDLPVEEVKRILRNPAARREQEEAFNAPRREAFFQQPLPLLSGGEVTANMVAPLRYDPRFPNNPIGNPAADADRGALANYQAQALASQPNMNNIGGLAPVQHNTFLPPYLQPGADAAGAPSTIAPAGQTTVPLAGAPPITLPGSPLAPFVPQGMTSQAPLTPGLPPMAGAARGGFGGSFAQTAKLLELPYYLRQFGRAY